MIGLVAAIAQEALILFEKIRNPAERLDLEAAWATLHDYATKTVNATSMGITDAGLVCAWKYNPEVNYIMEGITQDVLMQAETSLPPSIAASEIAGGNTRR